MQLKKYPNLNVELFGRCNAKCVFCFTRRSTRARAPMPDSTFKKIVSEVSKWGERVDMTPHGYSEPFLNPRWYEQYKYIQDNAPNVNITIATNGSLLSDDNIDKLVSLRSLTSIVLSAYAIRPDTYFDLMGLDPSNLARLDHIAERLTNERKDVELIIGCSDSLVSHDEWGEFVFHWSIRGIKVMPHPMILLHTNSEITDSGCNIPCPDMFATLQILNDGTTTGCCVDSDGELSFGNVNDKTILEIWNGEAAWKCRSLHMNGLRSTIPVCRSCSRPCDMEHYRKNTLIGGIPPTNVRHRFQKQQCKGLK
jgi:hypothetical protein